MKKLLTVLVALFTTSVVTYIYATERIHAGFQGRYIIAFPLPLENNDSLDYKIYSEVLSILPSKAEGNITLESVSLRKEVKVLPAISDGTFYVYNPKDLPIICNILNIQGQKVTQKVLSNTGINKIEILNNQPGMYIIIFTDPQGIMIGRQKIIKL